MVELSDIPERKFIRNGKTEFVVAVDLGKMSDYTAIAVLENFKGVWDKRSDYERHTNTGLKTRQKPGEFIEVRWLERLLLGTQYPDQVERVRALLAEPPLCGNTDQKPAQLIIDESGPGQAVADLFNELNVHPQRVTITGGSEVNSKGQNRWAVAKSVLVSTTEALLHTNTLQFAPTLPLAEVAKEELKNFRRKLSDIGTASFAARSGKHDDLVLAVSIGCWWLARPKALPAGFGIQSGTVPPEDRGF